MFYTQNKYQKTLKHIEDFELNQPVRSDLAIISSLFLKEWRIPEATHIGFVMITRSRFYLSVEFRSCRFSGQSPSKVVCSSG